MKKLILVLVMSGAALLLTGCGADCCNTTDSCCGNNSYSGIWY